MQGHGERDTASTRARRLQRRSPTALGRENYMVEKLVLAQAGSVPDDAAVVVVAGPKTDFFPPEIDALKKYLDKAGKLLLQIDPPDKADSPPLSNLIALAHEWGMEVGNDIVVDASGMGRLIGTDASVARRRHLWLASDHRELQLRDGVSAGALGHAGDGRRQRTHRAALCANQPAKLGGSRHQGHAGHRQSVARRDERRQEGARSRSRPPHRRRQHRLRRPRPSRSRPIPRRRNRKRVWRSSAIRTSPPTPALGIQGNRDLFMNILGWLSQQENLIAIRPKNPEDRRITLTDTQQRNIIWLSLLVIPACIFGTGVYSWCAEATLDARPAIHHRAAGRADRPRRLHLLRRFGRAGERDRHDAGTRVRRARRRQDRRAQGQVGIGRNDEREERRGDVADDGAARRKGE